MPTAQKLIGVMDTLYITLYARIYVSKHIPSFFYDTKALSLESSIPNSMIQKQSNEYVCMASACRQYVLDHKNSIQNIDIYKRGVRIAKFYVKI